MPPTDPRFLDLTLEDIAVEYWADVYFKDPERDQKEIVDEDFDLEAIKAEIERSADNPDDWEEVDLNGN